MAAAHRRMLSLIAEIDRRRVWRDLGARDTAHWLSIRYGVSQWKARRWIDAAHALESLPAVSEALESGELHLDKVVELTRFATPETESRLLVWAGGVSCGAIRRKADVAIRRTVEDVEGIERSRSLTWWTFDDGRRFGIEGELSPAHRAPSWPGRSTTWQAPCRSCRTRRDEQASTRGARTPPWRCARPRPAPNESRTERR